MNKPESVFWDWLDRQMAGKWDVQRHEDKFSVGIPDLSYALNGVDGWIELKAYIKWPTDKLPHFTAKQVNWLSDRGYAGNGHCYLLIKVKSTILLYVHWSLRELRANKCDEKFLRKKAFRIWDKTFDVVEFIQIIGEKDEL